MAAKSIIEIDVVDGAWQKFQGSFTKYQTQLGAQATAWGKVNSAIKSSKEPFSKMNSAIGGVANKIKSSVSLQQKFTSAAQNSGRAITSLAKGTAAVAGNIVKATKSLIKWAGITSIISGLLGAGGLFGIDRLAASAGNSRRQSQGLGVGAGELKSAQVNFSKFTDVDSTLENIANTRSDLSKRWIFSALGVDPNKGSNVDVMAASMKAAKHSFEQNGMTQQGADAHGLTNLYSMDDLRRLHAMTDREIDDSVRKQQADKESLSAGDNTLRAWQDLSIQLSKAGSQIETVLINKLVSLSGPLSRLSDSVGRAFNAFLNSPQIGKWIDGLGDSIQKFSKYLVSDDFKSDIDEFIDTVKQVSSALYRAFVWLGAITPKDKEKTSDVVKDKQAKADKAVALAKASPTTENKSSAEAAASELQKAKSVAKNPQSAWDIFSPGNIIDTVKQWSGTHWKADSGPEVSGKISYPQSSGDEAGDIPAEPTGKNLSRAARNNNPGNLRRWGDTPVEDGYAKFSTIGAGIRAMGSQLQLYGKRGNDTIKGIISKWAPSSENNTGAYISDVSRRTGLDPEEHLDLNNREVLSKLMVAMSKHEDSKSTLTQSVVSTSLAGQAQNANSTRYSQPIVVEVRNNTGGNAIVTTNALAQ